MLSKESDIIHLSEMWMIMKKKPLIRLKLKKWPKISRRGKKSDVDWNEESK